MPDEVNFFIARSRARVGWWEGTVNFAICVAGMIDGMRLG
jgi:hypothetical protein